MNAGFRSKKCFAFVLLKWFPRNLVFISEKQSYLDILGGDFFHPKTVRATSEPKTCLEKTCEHNGKYVQHWSQNRSQNVSNNIQISIRKKKHSKTGAPQTCVFGPVRGVRGDPEGTPPGKKQTYCKWVKCKVGCMQHKPTPRKRCMQTNQLPYPIPTRPCQVQAARGRIFEPKI